VTLRQRSPARPGRAGDRSAGSGRPRPRYQGLWLGLAGLVGFGLVLEALPRVGVAPRRYLPPTSEILAELGRQATGPRLWEAVGNTLTTWLIGLAVAVAAAVILGVLIGSVPLLHAGTASTIEFLRPIPSVAWIPAAIVLYGPVRAGTLVIVVYAAFWQMLVQVLHGVADVDPVASDTARSYRLGRLARVRWVTWPTALPYMVTGLRLAATVALILTVTGELFVGTPGLGAEILQAANADSAALTYALVVVTGMVGVAANLLLRAMERRVLAWHPSVRREVPA
jgi:ABC-type nitrate/sulfonate/bicarbonate transport system permease component